MLSSRKTNRRGPIVRARLAFQKRPARRGGHGRSPAGRGQIVGRWIFQLVEMVVPIRRQLKPSARNPSQPRTECERKGGAECVWICVVHRTATTGDSRSQVYHRDDVMETLLAGEIQRQIDVVKV